jgi:hypothetical protein
MRSLACCASWRWSEVPAGGVLGTWHGSSQGSSQDIVSRQQSRSITAEQHPRRAKASSHIKRRSSAGAQSDARGVGSIGNISGIASHHAAPAAEPPAGQYCCSQGHQRGSTAAVRATSGAVLLQSAFRAIISHLCAVVMPPARSASPVETHWRR